MKNCWSKSRLITSVFKKSDNYDENIKIKIDSGDKLPLNKKIEIPVMEIIVTAIFYENNKYYLTNLTNIIHNFF